MTKLNEYIASDKVKHLFDSNPHSLRRLESPEQFYTRNAFELVTGLIDAITTDLTANYMHGGKDNKLQYRRTYLEQIRGISNDIKHCLVCLDRRLDR